MATGQELAQRLRKRWALLEIVATPVGALVAFTFLHAFHSAEDPSHTVPLRSAV
jgi:hypothetical protein